MWRRRVLAPVLCLVFALLAAGASSAAARVPQGFVGMMAATPLFNRGINLSAQLEKMVSSGVESLRVEFNWNADQPYASPADVPRSQAGQFQTIDGVPTSFAATDKIVGLAARRRMSVLAEVLSTPGWAASTHYTDKYNLPASNASYARFVRALVEHYGPGGTFWQQHPAINPVPIRMWQIWNEPNLDVYWPLPTFPRGYVSMLRAAHDAIKRVDPGAEVIMAGMPNDSWNRLGEIYGVAGAERLFDAVAVHPFTAQPSDVIKILKMVRDVMNQHGDSRKPLLASEVSWPTSVGKTDPKNLFGFETTAAGQATNITALLPMLGAQRRQLGLQGFYWASWVTLDDHGGASFDFAGLFRLRRTRLIAKPGFDAFRTAALKLEGCSVKGPLATSCARR